MALQGTLKDFGIGDILQLIGQQQKTGILHVRSRDQEVQVGFREGAIVRAESSTRRRKDLIGNMLVRAELITEAQLEQALEMQKRSLKRLGDVLVSHGMLSSERFRRAVQLQVSETLYGLFTWKSGTYAFEQQEVEYDPEALSPLRAESVLMEGFRRVDEWPLIRKLIHSDALTFTPLRALPAAAAASGEEDALDAAFDALEEGGGEGGGSELQAVGPNERAVFARVGPEMTVRRLADVSLLGEFETCKALHNLVSLGYLQPAGTSRGQSGQAGAALLARLALRAGQAALAAGVLAVVGLLALSASQGALGWSRAPSSVFADAAAERHLSVAQQARLRAALDVYRLERGQLPEALPALVSAGLLTEGDLSHPWAEPYYYRRTGPGAYILLPPLR